MPLPEMHLLPLRGSSVVRVNSIIFEHSLIANKQRNKLPFKLETFKRANKKS
jgi:hypothetical protein